MLIYHLVSVARSDWDLSLGHFILLPKLHQTFFSFLQTGAISNCRQILLKITDSVFICARIFLKLKDSPYLVFALLLCLHIWGRTTHSWHLSLYVYLSSFQHNIHPVGFIAYNLHILHHNWEALLVISFLGANSHMCGFWPFFFPANVHTIGSYRHMRLRHKHSYTIHYCWENL